MRDDEHFLIPEVDLGFPEGAGPRQALISILRATHRLFAARLVILSLPIDHLAPFGCTSSLVDGRLQLAEGIVLDVDEVRGDELSRGCADGLPRLVEGGERLLLPTALGALVLEAPDLDPASAPTKIPLAQALAAYAASTASWSVQLAGAEQRARDEAEAHQELRLESARLRELSELDELTGLCNRRFFSRRLEHEVSRFRRYGHPLSLALIDVDHFKELNDTYGHLVGDAALKHLADRAMATLRESDVLARIGGDELAMILPDTPLSGGACAAERLRKALIEHPFEVDDCLIEVTLSIGVAGVEETGLGEARAFFQAADEALYLAKKRGRDQIAVMRDSRVPPALDESKMLR